MIEIQMVRNTADEWPDDAPPGTFDIPVEGGRIMFVCPNGHRCGVLLQPFTAEGLNSWTWDGNANAPTLSPSINCIAEKDGKPTGACGWHGFIQKGVMR